MSRRRQQKKTDMDVFARAIAVVSLVVALAAVAIPVWQDHKASQEDMRIWMRTNSNGFVLLPSDRASSSVIQVPWLLTLTNSGEATFSITGYDVVQLENEGMSRFANLVGFVLDKEDIPVVPPFTLSAGESKIVKMHLGFIAQREILDSLFALHSESGAFTLQEAFEYLAESGRTIYGGVATAKAYGDSKTISVDAESYLLEPVYRVEFVTGEGTSFFAVAAETMARFGS